MKPKQVVSAGIEYQCEVTGVQASDKQATIVTGQSGVFSTSADNESSIGRLKWSAWYCMLFVTAVRNILSWSAFHLLGAGV